MSTGTVSSHQTFGEYASWHPHWHTIVLEGGFDQHDRFYFIPIGASEGLQELWRRRVIALFVGRRLLDEGMAISMLGWQHSGFSVEAGTRIYDDAARQSLSQYIVRAPVGLEMLTWDRDEDTLSWKAPEGGHWKGEVRHFDSLDLIALVTLHIPPKGKHLVRRYGVYSSRGRSTWKTRPALKTRAPERWYGRAELPADGQGQST
ncbi:MAG: transposase, partial [Spirochaetaceae bacterium]|nr:transposase [Spirochaetaceae bacterium]